MTSEKSYITNVKSISSGQVTFGEGAFVKIVGKGTLNFSSLPSLKDVMLVGLTTNLISIS